MKSFKYIARGFTGERKEGLHQGTSSADVVTWLRDQGLTAISVEEIIAGVKKTRRTPRRKRIKSADMAALCWQLTTMVEGGIPITTAMETIAEEIENLQLQDVLTQVYKSMHKGETFSESISMFPRVFNRLSRSLILAGETGGSLPTSLHRLAEYYENRDKLARKVKGAMAYPIFVLGFIVLIVVFIMAFIIPRFRVIFDQIGSRLPAFTVGFIGVYDVICANLIYIIGALLLLTVALVLIYTKTKKGHYAFSKMALRIPIIGGVLSQAFLVTFCRTMSTLLAAGVSVLEVFDILGAMANNDVIEEAIVHTREHIVAGSNISLSMAAAGFFPNMVVKMVQVGEESGSMTPVLERTADYYERKVDSTITTLTRMLEPIMIITVGAIVLVVVLALYLPIFSMSDISR
ncbi:MAG: type II secretion system F family protein [Sedimentisphaerales bacterium]|nr:type II secretion system F family protein [Sedimentisphaerales bacterium]